MHPPAMMTAHNTKDMPPVGRADQYRQGQDMDGQDDEKQVARLVERDAPRGMTIERSDVQPNVAIDRSRFARPAPPPRPAA